MEAEHPYAPGYVTGLINGVDHGIRIRPENKTPTTTCLRCSQPHPPEEEE